MNPREKAAVDLIIRCVNARGVRRLCASRLEKKSQVSGISIILVSMSAVIIGFLFLFGDSLSLTDRQQSFFSGSNIILSFIIIVISVYENGNIYSVRASRMHRSADQITTILGDVRTKFFLESLSDQHVSEMSRSLTDILASTLEEPAPVDVHYFDSVEWNAVFNEFNDRFQLKIPLKDVDKWFSFRSILAREISIYSSLIFFFVIPAATISIGGLLIGAPNPLGYGASKTPNGNPSQTVHPT